MDKIINEINLEKAKRLIKLSKNPVIVLAQDEEYNRKVLEYGKFDVLLSPEKQTRNSRLKQEDSGMNHVLAKIASKNNIKIGIDLEEMSKMPKKEKAKMIAKLAQNIKIYRKTKTRMAILNSTNKQKGSAFLISIGASTKQAKEASQDF